MFCKNCGKELEEGARFCSGCGCSLSDDASPMRHKTVHGMEKTGNKKQILIVAGIAGVLVFIGIVVSIGLIKNSNNSISIDTANVLVQANMANLGYAVFDGEYTYFSDGRSGIYKLKEDGQKVLFIEGSYASMGLLDETIYCVEGLSSNDGTYRTIVVGINIANGNKSVIYAPPFNDEYYLWGINVTEDKYYFIVDNDTLFSVDGKGEVENTGIRAVRTLTENGIYTTEVSDYGLKLLSFEGKTIQTYSELSGAWVNVFLDLGDKIYLSYRDNDDNYVKMYCMNKSTGELSLFPNDESVYANNYVSSYVNYYEGTFYMSTSCWTEDGSIEYNVYSIDSDGGNIKKIYSQRSTDGVGICTINIVDGYLIISFPLTLDEPVITRLEK